MNGVHDLPPYSVRCLKIRDYGLKIKNYLVCQLLWNSLLKSDHLKITTKIYKIIGRKSVKKLTNFDLS